MLMNKTQMCRLVITTNFQSLQLRIALGMSDDDFFLCRQLLKEKIEQLKLPLRQCERTYKHWVNTERLHKLLFKKEPF